MIDAENGASLYTQEKWVRKAAEQAPALGSERQCYS